MKILEIEWCDDTVVYLMWHHLQEMTKAHWGTDVMQVVVVQHRWYEIW